MSPFLGPLDKELVKVILKLLRSASFLGTAQLLAAIASVEVDARMPVGLMKVGRQADRQAGINTDHAAAL